MQVIVYKSYSRSRYVRSRMTRATARHNTFAVAARVGSVSIAGRMI